MVIFQLTTCCALKLNTSFRGNSWCENLFRVRIITSSMQYVHDVLYWHKFSEIDGFFLAFVLLKWKVDWTITFHYICFVLFYFVLSSGALYRSLQDPQCPGMTTIHLFIRLTIHTTTFVVALSLPFNLFGGQRG
jgi:hypothetical protein